MHFHFILENYPVTGTEFGDVSVHGPFANRRERRKVSDQIERESPDSVMYALVVNKRTGKAKIETITTE